MFLVIYFQTIFLFARNRYTLKVFVTNMHNNRGLREKIYSHNIYRTFVIFLWAQIVIQALNWY